MKTDWQKLWQHVTREFQCDPHSVHGPTHWRNVLRAGMFLSEETGAVMKVVQLFAVFHDSRRENDGTDPEHGARGAKYAASLRGKLFELSDKHFQLLEYACTWHTHGQLHEDPTIGTCWDADRLDLGRVGILPRAQFMSTAAGRKMANDNALFVNIHDPKRKTIVGPFGRQGDR